MKLYLCECGWIGLEEELYNSTPNERHPAYQNPDVCPDCHCEDVYPVTEWTCEETWQCCKCDGRCLLTRCFGSDTPTADMPDEPCQCPSETDNAVWELKRTAFFVASEFHSRQLNEKEVEEWIK